MGRVGWLPNNTSWMLANCAPDTAVIVLNFVTCILPQFKWNPIGHPLTPYPSNQVCSEELEELSLFKGFS
jgi:hypothetical protein